jgi:chemotaxis protein MotB
VDEDYQVGGEAEEEEGAPAWTVTFGDMMSLLLCFFILMLSFSEMDRKKYRVVSGSIANAFGIQRKIPIFEPPRGQRIIAKEFDQAIATNITGDRIVELIRKEVDENFRDVKDLVETEAGENRVTIRMMGEATFDSGQAEIRPQFVPLLKMIGSVLQKSTDDIIVAGHTDNVPIKGGRYKSNLALSAARAASVAEFLLSHAAIRPSRISTMGFGEFRPLAPNSTAAGRQRNRRVEIILTREQ